MVGPANSEAPVDGMPRRQYYRKWLPPGGWRTAHHPPAQETRCSSSRPVCTIQPRMIAPCRRIAGRALVLAAALSVATACNLDVTGTGPGIGRFLVVEGSVGFPRQ